MHRRGRQGGGDTGLFCHLRLDPRVRYGGFCTGHGDLRTADEAAENEMAQRVRTAHQPCGGHGICHTHYRLVAVRRERQ